MEMGRFCIAGSPYFDMISGAKIENRCRLACKRIVKCKAYGNPGNLIDKKEKQHG